MCALRPSPLAMSPGGVAWPWRGGGGTGPLRLTLLEVDLASGEFCGDLKVNHLVAFAEVVIDHLDPGEVFPCFLLTHGGLPFLYGGLAWGLLVPVTARHQERE